MSDHELLVRDPPDIDLDGRSILVTGGTGSFGQRFVETVLERFTPKRLIVYSRDEYKQYQMALRFSDSAHPCLRYFIGDIRDRERLEMALRNVDVVVHAAALKHVPAAEYNPFECINTNVLGAENLVHAAIRTGVERVVALSTDKAASPINLYGASKLAADKIFVAANNLGAPTGTHFCAVRYGNVIGSRGSVVQLYRRLLEQGTDHLPITDPRMTRFWITLQQGVDFVLSSLAMMRGGEVFVPKIPSTKVTDIARVMGPGLEHRTIGIRPGEKVHEMMITESDSRDALDLGDRYCIEPGFTTWSRQSFDGPHVSRVPEGFVYSSDLNERWLTDQELQDLISKV